MIIYHPDPTKRCQIAISLIAKKPPVSREIKHFNNFYLAMCVCKFGYCLTKTQNYETLLLPLLFLMGVSLTGNINHKANQNSNKPLDCNHDLNCWQIGQNSFDFMMDTFGDFDDANAAANHAYDDCISAGGCQGGLELGPVVIEVKY